MGEAYTYNGDEQWVPGIRDEAGRLPVALLDSITLATLPGMTKHGVKVILNAKRAAGLHRMPPFNLLTDLDGSSLESADQYITRYGSTVNVNSASVEVLVALGLPERAAGKLVEWRSGSDRIPGTADDRHFLSLEGNNERVRACALNSEEAAVLALLHGAKKLTVKPRFFQLVSRGWGDQYNGICEIRVVLEKQDRGATRIMEWTENWLN